MASANDDAGETLSSQLPATIPRENSTLAISTTAKSSSTTLQYIEVAEDDDCASGSSSPPTHPAFFSPSKTNPKQRDASSTSLEEENVSPSALMGMDPMISSISLSGCPVAALVAQRPSSFSMKSAGAGARAGTANIVVVEDELAAFSVVGLEEDDCDWFGNCGNVKEGSLGNVDMNIVAALSSEKANGEVPVDIKTAQKNTSNKKSKRKNQKNNGRNDVDGDEKDQVTRGSTSYADAVKQDPADVEGREAQSDSEDSHTSVHDGGKTENTTLPGNKSFAEALKEPAQSISKFTHQKRHSEASTAVDYPELHSDSDSEKEKERRRRDRQNAPQVLSMRWAPLRVPIKRRLQTLAVLFHCLCMGISLSLFFFCCAMVPLWPVIIVYLIYLLFATDHVDGKLRSRREWVRKLPIWTYFAEYFPAKLHKTHDLIPTRKYIFGYHPHGIISHGAWAAFATDALGFSEKFPGITNSLLTLDSNFRLPLYREYVLSMGVQSVSKESITNLLTRGGPNKEGMGRAVTVVVGGARESLEAQPNTMHLVIKERKGFIKLALQTGADLVPVIAFGENDLYDQLDPHKHPWLHNMQRYFLKVWKFTVPLLHGRGIFNYDVGLMPYRRPMNIVVGKPIPVFQASTPDNAEVNRLHDLYTEELQKIWDRYKAEFAPHRKEEMEFTS